jgi:hypothetical protein
VMESPLRFQVVVAVLAIAAALVFVDRDTPPVTEPVLTFADAEIDESSGLVDLGDTVLTVNDSGSGPVLHVVDRETGRTVGRTTYTSDDVVDVEALSPGLDGTVLVGDIGDNRHARMYVSVYELPAPTPGDRTVSARRYDLAYQGGPRDAEALLVHPVTGRLYVVSKGLFGGQVFQAPPRLSTDRVNVLRPIGPTGGMITDGAFFPDGRNAVLRSYGKAFLYDTDPWESVTSMPLPRQQQGEGLAMTRAADRVLVSTEGRHTRVLSVPLSEEILTEVAKTPSESPAAPTASSPTGSSDRLSTGVVAGVAVAVVAAVIGGLVVRAARRRSRSPR